MYLKSLGSLTEHLLLQDSISNEDIIGMLLDFKVAWELSEESGYVTGEILFSIMNEMFGEEDAFLIMSPWVMNNFYPDYEDSILYN